MYIQSFRFIIIGIVNTITSYIIFCLCLSVLQYDCFVSLVISYIFGIANSYFWNSRWTFQKEKTSCGEFSKFIIVYITAFAVNLMILNFTINIIRINVLLSQGIALVFATAFSFTGHKFWSFKNV